MASTDNGVLRQQIVQARSKFLAMATCYGMGTFNDNFFRQATLMLAVSAGKEEFQQYAIVLFGLPYLLFSAPAGWLADRFSKHHIVIGAKALELAAMLCGAAGICLSSWPLMFGMVFMMGLQSAIFSPSLNGSIPELYPASYVTAANARLKVATTGAILLGIGLAGFALDRQGAPIAGVERGRVTVALLVLGVSALGLLTSFGVPKRAAAAPHKRFPWAGPLSTLAELWRIRNDHLLTTVVGTNAFVWFVGSVELLVINVLGLKQFGLTKTMTGVLCLAQLTGVAAGGLLSSRLAKGRYWYRVLSPAAIGMGASMLWVANVPLMPGWLRLPLLLVLFIAAGTMGGLLLVPCEAFIQVRPAAEVRGAVIAAANFAVFTGIVLSGPIQNSLLAHMAPTTCFAALGGLAMAVGLVLTLRLPPGPGNLLDILTVRLARLLFKLRYRISVTGLEDVAKRGQEGILFLPNHPALIDPPMILSLLWPRFAPRTWADEDQVDRPLIRTFARRLGVMPIPSVSRHGRDSRSRIEMALEECGEMLKDGQCVLLYPSGRAYRSHLENLRGNVAVHRILSQTPDARVVLVRTRGIWGSSFSWASGRMPLVGPALWRGLKGLLVSGLFFAPRRRVTIELHEPDDLPRDADRDTLNDYLERFYNVDAPPNLYVPYSIWEKGGARTLDEPHIGAVAGDVAAVPEGTRGLVLDRLREETGITDIRDHHELARDLNVDSLAKAELVVWLEEEFGFPQGNAETLQTVGDVLLAACGETVVAEPEALKAVPPKWFRSTHAEGLLQAPVGNTVPAAFLNAARRWPGLAIAADQNSGVRTYRDIVTAIYALLPEIQAIPGERLGIMLPASVTAVVAYLTTLFAGKTPVMVNWTGGERNVRHSLDLVGMRHVVTARALVDRLAAQGNRLANLSDRFVLLEEVGGRISTTQKLTAWLKARLNWRKLRTAPISDTAVILFTSGSESLPKAVPLTHANILANLCDVCEVQAALQNDRLIAILPPFHSFGLTVTIVLATCCGVQTVYYPDPTAGGMLARMIEAYKVSLLVGTPTFLNGIVRASTSEQLATLRLAVTGAEKCPERVYAALTKRCPHTTVMEGYGITECSPIAALNDPRAPCRGAIGRPLPSVEHAIVDVETGERVGPNARGMLLLRGPSIFGGYINYDGPSPFMEFDGKSWYRTGDLVVEDDDGVLTFAGRLKRFTKLGGEMISLPAIEAVLADHYPADDEDGPTIAVEATDDEHAEIVLFTTRQIEREAANVQIREAGLSALHNIRRVIRVGEIPVLGTGKTDYRALRDGLSEGRF